MKTATFQVTLTPELEQFVEDKVRSGRYQDASEVIREALRVLEQGIDRVEDPALETLIQEGLDSGPATEMTPETWRQLRREARQRAAAERAKRVQSKAS